jgi:hypothetical protein
MKIIITEEQKRRIDSIIYKYFEQNIVPVQGWWKYDEYEFEIGENGGELYIPLVGYEDADTAGIWYSVCDNLNYDEPFEEGTCPLVAIVKGLYNQMEGFFPGLWQPLFIKWFRKKTGLKIIKVQEEY